MIGRPVSQQDVAGVVDVDDVLPPAPAADIISWNRQDIQTEFKQLKLTCTQLIINFNIKDLTPHHN